MMSASQELRQRVFAAADDLARAGESVTVNRVRGMVRADQNTVGPLIKEWKANHTVSSTSTAELPAEAQRALRLVWNTATDLAASDFASAKEQLRGEVEAAREESDAARTSYQHANEEIGRQRRQIHSLQEELAQTREQLAAEKARRSAAEERLEHTQTSLAAEQARLAELIATVTAARPTMAERSRG